MVDAAQPTAGSKARALDGERLALIALTLALVGLTGLRLWFAAVQPLWLDESWTAMVAAAPLRDLPGLLRADPNPPLFYLTEWIWAHIAGTSNLALRAPGALWLVLAAALPMLMPVGGLSRIERLGWSGMIAFWWVVDQFLLARGYPMLIALSTLQLILFIRLLEAPSTGRAFAWSATAAAAILVHYYAGPIAAVQGLVFLFARRRAALACWPAALPFVVAAAWLAWHAPSLARFADPQYAWHNSLGFAAAVRALTYTLHPTAAPVAALIAGVVAIGLISRKGAATERKDEPWLALAAVWIGLLLVVASAIWKPTLIHRYLVPAVPGVLMTLVLLTRRSRAPTTMLAALVGIYLAVLPTPFAMTRGPNDTSLYNYERPSAFLAERGVSDVVFIWDHETAQIQAPAAMRALGGFFFTRSGHGVAITAPAWKRGDDLNDIALAAAHGQRPGIIWLFNRNARTEAAVHPPRIDRIDPRWTCRDFSEEGLGSVACFRN